MLDTRVAIDKYRSEDRDICWSNVDGCFGENQDWFARKINRVLTFWLIPSMQVPMQEPLSQPLLLRDTVQLQLENCRF